MVNSLAKIKDVKFLKASIVFKFGEKNENICLYIFAETSKRVKFWCTHKFLGEVYKLQNYTIYGSELWHNSTRYLNKGLCHKRHFWMQYSYLLGRNMLHNWPSKWHFSNHTNCFLEPCSLFGPLVFFFKCLFS